ncbi:MAG: hypothetical protein WDO24_15815 [Pseudomonadota bacterium]
MLDLEGDLDQPAVADILIEGERISAVGPILPPDQTAGATVIDAADRLIVPGLVNAHYHSYDVLAKGLVEDLPLEQWGPWSVRWRSAAASRRSAPAPCSARSTACGTAAPRSRTWRPWCRCATTSSTHPRRL